MSEFGEVEVQRMQLVDLRPAEYNPRQMDDKAFQGLGASIDKFGVIVPIVWNKRTGNIVGGHQRFRYLASIGERETDVVVVDLDSNKEVALNITLNNKMIRGDFIPEVNDLLGKSEAQLGSAFKEIGLEDMREFTKKLRIEINVNTEMPGRREHTPKEHEPDPAASAVITCPNCKSKWRMTDNVVVVDTTKETKP